MTATVESQFLLLDTDVSPETHTQNEADEILANLRVCMDRALEERREAVYEAKVVAQRMPRVCNARRFYSHTLRKYNDLVLMNDVLFALLQSSETLLSITELYVKIAFNFTTDPECRNRLWNLVMGRREVVRLEETLIQKKGLMYTDVAFQLLDILKKQGVSLGEAVN